MDKTQEFSILWEQLSLTSGKNLSRLSLREQGAIKDMVESVFLRSSAKLDELRDTLQNSVNHSINVDIKSDAKQDHALIELLMSKFNELNNRLDSLQVSGIAVPRSGSVSGVNSDVVLDSGMFDFNGDTNIDSVNVRGDTVGGVDDSIEALRLLQQNNTEEK